MGLKTKPLDDNGILFLWQQIFARFVSKESGKGLSTHDLTDELLEKIMNAGNSSFDGNYGSLTNQPQINGITLEGNKTLADLGITQAITDAIGKVNQISYDIKNSFEDLPETGKIGVFYLVKNSGSENNNYDEYLWNGKLSKYELLGSIQREIDLSGYVKATDIVPLTNDEILNIINSVTA